VLLDLREWLKAAKIEHHYPAFLMQNMTGNSLAELKHLHAKPEFFFLHICTQLGITNAGDLLELSAALRLL
jgi:hypothetical protein